MTALSLLNSEFNRRMNRFEPEFWLKDFDAEESNDVSLSSQVKFDDTSSAWHLTVEAAGVKKDNLKVDAKQGLLTISGEKTKGLYLGKFERHFKLPEGVDLEKIEAEFENGILTVQLPLESKKAPKAIQIK